MSRSVGVMSLALLMLALPNGSARTPRGGSDRKEVQAGGYRISGPHTHANLTIFLLHGKNTLPNTPFLTLAEALAQKKAVVHETEHVNQLALENLAKDCEIFIQSGDLVRGGKQDRSIASDVILPRRSGKVSVPAFCVEKGRWRQRQRENATRFEASTNQLATTDLKLALQFGGGFNLGGGMDTGRMQAGGIRPGPVAQFGQIGGFNLGGFQFGGLQFGGFQFGGQPGRMPDPNPAPAMDGQSAIWKQVIEAQRKLSQRLGKSVESNDSPTSLQLTLEDKDLKKKVGQYLKELGKITKGEKEVIGFAYAINGKVMGADVYGSGELFIKLWPKLLEACVVEAVAELEAQKRFQPPKAAAVEAFLADAHLAKKKQEVKSSERIKGLIHEGNGVVLFETRDGQHKNAVLHRNYVAK